MTTAFMFRVYRNLQVLKLKPHRAVCVLLLWLCCKQELLDKATQHPQPNEQLVRVPLALYGNTSSGGGAVETIMEGVPSESQPSAATSAAGAPAAGVMQQH